MFRVFTVPAGVAGRALAALYQSLALGIQRAFLFTLAVSLAGLLMSVLLPEIPLRSSHDA